MMGKHGDIRLHRPVTRRQRVSSRIGSGAIEENGRSRVEIIPAKREALILEYLRRHGPAGIQELAQEIGASTSTIRRDLDQLVKKGALERTHGGALLQSTPQATFEPEMAVAAQLATEQKKAIGAAAAADLLPGQSVIFDSSTTVLEAAHAVATRDLPITAVTNNLTIAQVLAGVKGLQVVMLGGTLRAGTLTLVGQPGESFLRGIHADIALIGTHSITERLLTETSLEVAAMKQAMIKAARRVHVLADSSKFTAPSFCKICDISEIHEIITDDGLSSAHIANLRTMGVSFRIVPSQNPTLAAANE
jgi:DeoR family transcriptional regulator, aga operon transcriptional repressor